MGRFAGFVVMVGLCLTGAVWYARTTGARPAAHAATEVRPDLDTWIERLHSQNPTEAATAARELGQRGEAALPAIRAALEDPRADRTRHKAALKACALLGPMAAPVVDVVAEALNEPELTAEAAVALSFMGPPALQPLQQALASDDAVVRRESLRSLGKLKDRASLEAHAVLPILIQGMSDPDGGVRTVAATYLGIIHQGGKPAVGALMAGLTDAEADVRRASATALGSFEADAKPALPALKKATTDGDEDVAREAGLALVKLQERK